MPRPRRSRRKKQKQSVSLKRLKHLPVKAPLTLTPRQQTQCGVLARGQQLAKPPTVFGKLPIKYGKLRLPYGCTVIWKPGTPVNQRAVTEGLARLLSPGDTGHAWEMLALVVDQNLLASAVGSEAERAKTLKVVGDLRLPVYDVRMLWVRRTTTTRRVIASWAAEMEQGAHEQHAFLRALYKERAMLCTLPPGWPPAAK